ncbi:MAG: hypothetical protein JW892_02775 [Anaerolineae bacterium]|nr:hypothetical protein [Anaerolineae bacterium]
MSATAIPTTTVLQTPKTSGNSLDELVEQIQSVCPTPVHTLQIVALLESGGLTDALAQKRYNYPNVFALAENVAQHMLPAAPALPPSRALPRNRYAALNDYARGPLSLLPMILLSLMITLYQNYGRWATTQVLTLSISMMGSLLATSGFVQAASRKSSSYLSQGYAKTAGRVLRNSMWVALVFVLIFGLGVLGVALLWGWLSVADGVLMLVAYGSLSCLWLLALGLGLLNRMHWFGVGLGVGLGVSYGGLQGLARLGLAHAVVMSGAVALGLLSAAGVMILVIRRSLAQEIAASPVGAHDVVLAPLAQILFNLAPYFLYGVFYVLLILAGHTFGWWGRLPPGVTRTEALTSTELGLTLALGGFILTSGVAEHTMRRFWEVVQAYQYQISLHSAQVFSVRMREFYRRERWRYGWVLLLSSLALWGGVLGLGGVLQRSVWMTLPWNASARLIFQLGLLGYAALALGLFDCMFMITLGRPGWAIRALLAGTLATLITCLALGQWVSYQVGAAGILAGAVVFLGAAHYRFLRLLANLDYFYYASF